MFIRKYKDSDFDQLCHVMDRARMQELETANMEQVFIQLKDAPYLRYLLKCKIYVAIKEEKMVGFVGLRSHELSFLYVDPNFSKARSRKETNGVCFKAIRKTNKARSIY